MGAKVRQGKQLTPMLGTPKWEGGGIGFGTQFRERDQVFLAGDENGQEMAEAVEQKMGLVDKVGEG